MSWKRVCTTGDIAVNGLRKFDVDGVAIVVANVDGLFVAFPPLCPHMEEPLEVSGLCGGNVLTCTKHLWQWDLRNGEAMGVAERPLLLYPVRTQADDVLVLVESELKYDYELD